ncbi:ferritin [Candidatus Dependentiae bacterium]|nr:ferritin [Candidatus Dependentiae bacterium]
MGTRGAQILQIDGKKIIELLNKAFADEWLAYYQYWVGAQVVRGPMRGAVVAELLQHAADELRHAQMLSDRIIQLGGKPLIDPKEWYTHTNCGYSVPEDEHIKAILKQNIEGEQCAIDVYDRLLKLTHEKDVVTYQISSEILNDEVEHEEDLQALLDDINLIK